MTGLAGSGKRAAAAACLLFATWTGAVETADARLETPGDGSNESAVLQTEYARLMALARSRHKTVSTQKGRIDVSGLPAVGSEDAALTIVEFSSYQCGYCRRHFSETLPTIKAEYVATGRLRYVFRDLVLDSTQQNAAGAAEAAYCADEQSGYQAFRSRLFRPGTDLTPASLRGHARAVGLDMALFQACIDSGRHRAKSTIDPAMRRQLQIHGTPTFIVGFLDRHADEVVALRRIIGAQPIDLFDRQFADLDPVRPRIGVRDGYPADLEDQ